MRRRAAMRQQYRCVGVALFAHCGGSAASANATKHSISTTLLATDAAFTKKLEYLRIKIWKMSVANTPSSMKLLMSIPDSAAPKPSSLAKLYDSGITAVNEANIKKSPVKNVDCSIRRRWLAAFDS